MEPRIASVVKAMPEKEKGERERERNNEGE